MLDKSNEITGITFDEVGSHIALCHKSQGFSANGRPKALIVKAGEEEMTVEAKLDLEKVAEVKLEISMMEYLQRFMGMYYYEAKQLAYLLGYDVDDCCDDYDPLEYVKQQTEGITLLKSAIEKNIKDTATIADVKALADMIEKTSLVSPKTSTSGDLDPKTQEPKGNPSPEDIHKQKGESMSIEKSKETLDLEAKVVELQKAADKLALLEKAEKERTEECYLNLVKSLSFVQESDQLDMVQAIIKADSTLLVSVLEKAKDLVEKGFTEETGFDGAGGNTPNKESNLDKLIKAKYSK